MNNDFRFYKPIQNEPVSARELFVQFVNNLCAESAKDAKSIFGAWKETVQKIDEYGERLLDHTRIIDLKNEILLVETDHPGWTQILQMHEKFILQGLKWKLPNLKIKSMAFRLKGSDVQLP